MKVLRDAVRQFGVPGPCLSDNGSCFVGATGRYVKGKDGKRMKAPSGSWQPTTFEAELLDLSIGLINSRP